MLGIKTPHRKGGKEEAEKPFWISFSDLMTALMVLFLVAMAVALMAVTQTITPQIFTGPPSPPIKDPLVFVGPPFPSVKEPPIFNGPPFPPIKSVQEDNGEMAREESISNCLSSVKKVTQLPQFAGLKVHGSSIDFGTLVTFANNQHSFERIEQAQFIRRFVPKILDLARTKQCEQWLKRVVVEGFASQTGGYLYNLNLSYLRSQRVLCELLNASVPDALNVKDRNFVQALFLVGGSSFNTSLGDESQMRRVELKLEFRDLNAKPDSGLAMPLDSGSVCPNDIR